MLCKVGSQTKGRATRLTNAESGSGSQLIHLDERSFSRSAHDGDYFFSSSSVPCFWMKCFAFSATIARSHGNLTSTST